VAIAQTAVREIQQHLTDEFGPAIAAGCQHRSATASRAPIKVPSEKALMDPKDPINKENAAIDA